MNIYATAGDKVVFANPDAGHLSDRKQCQSLLKVGNTYTINYTEVDSSHTDVYLKEFPGERFNSAMFEDA